MSRQLELQQQEHRLFSSPEISVTDYRCRVGAIPSGRESSSTPTASCSCGSTHSGVSSTARRSPLTRATCCSSPLAVPIGSPTRLRGATTAPRCRSHPGCCETSWRRMRRAPPTGRRPRSPRAAPSALPGRCALSTTSSPRSAPAARPPWRLRPGRPLADEVVREAYGGCREGLSAEAGRSPASPRARRDGADAPSGEHQRAAAPRGPVACPRTLALPPVADVPPGGGRADSPVRDPNPRARGRRAPGARGPGPDRARARPRICGSQPLHHRVPPGVGQAAVSIPRHPGLAGHGQGPAKIFATILTPV